MKNILSSFLTIKRNVLKSKLSSIKAIFISSLNVFKSEMNAAISKSDVFKQIILKNTKITNSINIISNKIFRENQLFLRISSKMKSSNNLIRYFSTLLTLLLKILIRVDINCQLLTQLKPCDKSQIHFLRNLYRIFFSFILY